MKRKLWPLVFLALTACRDPGNPKQLWIDLDGAGLKLVDEEPDPF
jgi:hypothetical protein